MDSRQYLACCQKNAVYGDKARVKYNGVEMLPKSLTVWFDHYGEMQYSAELKSINGSNSVICADLKNVTPLDK